MANQYFQFKQFTIHQDRCAMKVTTDACLFGAWVAEKIESAELATERCLDIGTGTGLLSLMLAQKINGVTDAIEIDKEAAEQAKENVAKSPWTERINVIKIDAKEYSSKSSYDLIISNPPFYENELKSGNNQKNIAHHSEDLDLKNLLITIKRNLSADGHFCLLLPFKREAEIKPLLSEQGFSISQMTFVKQSLNHHFFRIMLIGKLKSNEDPDPIISEIAIKENTQPNSPYTPAFIHLLKDFYLHL